MGSSNLTTSRLTPQPVATAPRGALSRSKTAARQLARNITWSPFARVLVQNAERFVPFLRAWHSFAYEQHFARITPWSRMFRGVYPSFAEAQAAAPPNKQIGYDNQQAATFLPPSGPLLPSDYPVLFWLQRLLPCHPSIFDFGGYVGISYYSYQNYLPYPDNLSWLIYDVPAVVAAGRKLTAERPSRGLSFTSDLSRGSGSSLFLAFGSLMFTEQPLAHILSAYEQLPDHLILNKVALYDGPPFVTLQDLGPAVCPYQVFNREQFVSSITGLGYELIDSWANTELGCFVPFHPEKWVPHYSGAYFRKLPS